MKPMDLTFNALTNSIDTLRNLIQVQPIAVYVHPHFLKIHPQIPATISSPEDLEADIALIEFDPKSVKVAMGKNAFRDLKTRLDLNPVSRKDLLWIGGYGIDEEGGTDRLRVAPKRVKNFRRYTYEISSHDADKITPFDTLFRGSYIRFGDSGGPAYRVAKDGRLGVVGINSSCAGLGWFNTRKEPATILARIDFDENGMPAPENRTWIWKVLTKKIRPSHLL